MLSISSGDPVPSAFCTARGGGGRVQRAARGVREEGIAADGVAGGAYRGRVQG